MALPNKNQAVDGTDDARTSDGGSAESEARSAVAGELGTLIDGLVELRRVVVRRKREAERKADSELKNEFPIMSAWHSGNASALRELVQDIDRIAARSPAMSEKLSNPEPRSGGGLGAVTG